MRTSEVAGRAGVNPQTLRYYERRGLLPPPPRSASGYRSYPDDTVRVIRFVKRAQGLGFTLDEVEELLGLAGGGPGSCESALRLAQSRLTDLAAKIAELERMRDALRRLVDSCARPTCAGDCALLDAIEPA
jgi:MerR family mercuric resistance operon transcriptional regulator